MKVPYNYLDKEFKNHSEIFNQWKKLIKSTDFTLGKYVSEFERKFSEYIGTKYAISTNNGTDALILCLKSLGITKGDEVITVVNTFYATVGAIHAVGAKPIFCDCDDRYQINIDDINRKITKKTKAIMPVHWGGASPDMYKIVKIAKKKNIPIIEDACMGIGAKLRGKSPGTFGKVNAFSLHPLKSLNAMGDGGVVVTDNKKIYQWLRKYRNHGMVDRDNIEFWGVNNRMQPTQAIVAMWGLKKINKVIKQREKNMHLYDELLKPISQIIVPQRIKNYTETNALYMILCEERDSLKKYLENKGIEPKIHYPLPLNLQKAFKDKDKKYNQTNFVIAEKQAKKLLTLPVHQFINKRQIEYTVKCIKKFYS